MKRPSSAHETVLQRLWGGYGRIVRTRDGSTGASLIVKDIRWPAVGQDRSHLRKLRSYQVESHWYSTWASQVPETCRIAKSLGQECHETGMRLVLEDLDGCGFARRTSRPQGPDLEAAIGWLAVFHATFLGTAPDGLWEEGTYWHLATRPDELEAMPQGPLREAAVEIDRRLGQARFRTIVHGDAKPDNFCFGAPGQIAAVDFQYVGGGCGMRDLAYLLDCVLDTALDDNAISRCLDTYFVALSKALAQDPAKTRLAQAVEAEWRGLFPVAWLDFQRFLQGWSPGYARPSARLERRIRQELSKL
jgi:hypothetical protein